MEKKSKKSIIIGLTTLFLIILILLGLTYAYYKTKIIGNESTDPSISVVSKNLEVTYQDGDATFSTGSADALIEPGFVYTKLFSVKNTGGETASYSIVLDNLTNEFTRSDWTYKLYSGTSAVDENLLDSGQLVSEVSDTEQILIGQRTILSTTSKDDYYLVINYENMDEDQSIDMGKSLSLRVNIKDTTTTWDEATEGTLLYALRENNEVVEPLSAPGRSESGKKYTEGEMSTTTETLNLVKSSGFGDERDEVFIYQYYDLYIAYGTGYEFHEDSGLYTLTGVDACVYKDCYQELASKKVYLLDVGSRVSNQDYRFKFYKGFETSKEGAIIHYVKDTGLTFEYTGRDKLYQIQNATFDSITYTSKTVSSSTMSEAVLSSAEDDYGTSYYFRGNGVNNYVNYSGMCWRIVRVQGDGTIKLELEKYNSLCNESTGYGVALEQVVVANNYLSSGVPTELERWMNAEVKDTDGNVVRAVNLDSSKLATTEWCNDTNTIVSRTPFGYDNGYYCYTNDGTCSLVGTSSYTNDYYASYKRLYDRVDANPSYKCNAVGTNKIKAQKIINNIALLTADEVVFRGAVATHEVRFSNAHPTMTGSMSGHEWNGTSLWHYSGNTLWYTGDSGAPVQYVNWLINPVIALRSDVKLDATVSGQNGTQTNPYVIG